MSTDTEPFDQLPDALVERLRELDSQVAMLTPSADRAIETAARAQFAPRARRPAARRWRYSAAAAAAAAVLALFIVRPFEQDAGETLRLADDVDGSGRVDILDVFALARAGAADPAAVSPDRIAQLANRIVSLNLTEPVL